MFTNYYKHICQFGYLHARTTPVITLVNDERVAYKDIYGTTVYFPKHQPFVNYQVGVRYYNRVSDNVSGSNCIGWIFSTDTVDDGETISNFVLAYLISSSESSPSFRVSVTNNGNSDVVLKSLCYLYDNPRMPSQSTGTGTVTAKMLEIYYNLPTPITVPANDSVLIDITLSAGDVTSVSQI